MEPRSSLSCSQESVAGLNQMNPVHTTHSSKILYNIILPYICLLHIFLPTPLCTPPLPHTCYMLCPSHPPWLHDSNYIWQGVQVMKLLTVQFSSASYYFIPLGSKILSSAPCSQTPTVYVILLMSETKFHTRTKLQKIHNFVFFLILFLERKTEGKSFWTEW
jgi:hypothetical protein